MAVSNVTRWRIGKNRATRTVTTTTTTTHEFERKPGGWQLPCGCIGPDIMNSDTAHQAFCTFCGRGWRHMTDRCHMLDGKPQGAPVLVLTEKMRCTSIAKACAAPPR